MAGKITIKINKDGGILINTNIKDNEKQGTQLMDAYTSFSAFIAERFGSENIDVLKELFRSSAEAGINIANQKKKDEMKK